MNGLFGWELPTAVQMILAFVVVLALIGAATWAVKRFGMGRLEAAARGRQPRLAVVDQAMVDGRRKLVIVRRDNVEHLLMVGGGSDVVIETNIVRATAGAAREPAARTAPNVEALQRALPLPDPTPWPLAPEPAAAPTPAPAPRAERLRPVEPTVAEPQAPPPQRPAAPRPTDPLAGLAAELAQRPAPAPRPAQPEATWAPPPAPPPVPEPPTAADQNLADMAQRLEAALRRSGTAKAPAEVPRVEPRLDQPKPAPKPAPRGASAPAAGPTPPDKPALHNLEQEMASLLGRPSTGKT